MLIAAKQNGTCGSTSGIYPLDAHLIKRQQSPEDIYVTKMKKYQPAGVTRFCCCVVRMTVVHLSFRIIKYSSSAEQPVSTGESPKGMWWVGNRKKAAR